MIPTTRRRERPRRSPSRRLFRSSPTRNKVPDQVRISACLPDPFRVAHPRHPDGPTWSAFGRLRACEVLDARSDGREQTVSPRARGRELRLAATRLVRESQAIACRLKQPCRASLRNARLMCDFIKSPRKVPRRFHSLRANAPSGSSEIRNCWAERNRGFRTYPVCKSANPRHYRSTGRTEPAPLTGRGPARI